MDCKGYERPLRAHTGESRVTFQIMVGLSREENRCHARARIIGCDAQMRTFDFFFGLHLTQRPFGHTDNLYRSLQSSSHSAAAGQNLVTRQTLETIRSETSFILFFMTPSLSRKRNILSCLSQQFHKSDTHLHATKWVLQSQHTQAQLVITTGSCTGSCE